MASGAEVMMRCAAPFWFQAGIEPAILSTGETVGPYCDELEKAGYRIYHIRFRKSFSFFWAFLCLIKREKFQIVHIHSERASFYYALCARLMQAKVIRTIHSTFPFSGTLAIKRRAQRKILHWIKCYQVSIGQSVQETERQFLHNETILIPNWYDDKKYRIPTAEEQQRVRTQYGIPGNTFTIVSVGNCGPVKNHQTLIQALALFKESFDFKYLHVGKEEEGNPERKLASDLGIDDRVLFLGQTTDTVSPLFATDVFVMPSLHEGFGIAALEAMAVGIPVILSDVPGLKDWKSIEGIIWASPTPDSLEMALKDTISMRAEDRRTLGIKLSNQVKNHFATSQGVNLYTTLYCSVLKENGSKK